MVEDEEQADEYVPDASPSSPHEETEAHEVPLEELEELDEETPNGHEQLAREKKPDEQSSPVQPRAPKAPPLSDSDGEVELEEVPEELEPESADKVPPQGFEPPRGLPGLQPISDTEPEPEIATENDEEATLEPVEETQSSRQEEAVEEEPAPTPQRKTGSEHAPHAPTPKRSSDDVRKELRDYLNGVRDRLDKGAVTPASPVDLLDYLGKLSDYLPEREKKRFRGSNERLAMESIKARLAGKKGLRQKVAASFPQAPSRRKEPMTRSLVVDTFSYLKDLAAWHPDKAVGAAMRDRIESIVTRMGRSG
jgi:hypothetical protein